MAATDVAHLEERIAERISTDRALTVKIGNSGLQLRNMSDLLDFAKVMSVGDVGVPKHLRGKPGPCALIILQAIEWQLSPYAVANKSYSVNDRLAYEAQLIHAVLLLRAPIKGRPKFQFEGEGPDLRCTVTAVLKEDGDTVSYTSPPVGRIPIQNSPLWKNDTEQQLGYYSVRALARRHFPDVIMGVIEREEARYSAIDAEPAEPNPQAPKTRPSLTSKLESLVDENPAGEDTPLEEENGGKPFDSGEAEETDEDQTEDESATDEPTYEADELFERLKPAALKSQKALRLAIGQLSEEEMQSLSEETHRRLDMLAASRPQKAKD